MPQRQHVLRLPKAILALPDDVVRAFARKVMDEVVKVANEKVSGEELGVRSGGLRRYIVAQLRKNISENPKEISTGLPEGDLQARIAAAHELGPTVIRARNAKMLRVPLPPALTPKGVEKGPVAGRSFLTNPPDNPKLFLYRAKSGNLFLSRVKGTGKRSKLEHWYILKKSVRLPRRPWFTRTIQVVRGRIPSMADKALAAWHGPGLHIGGAS